MTLKELTKEKGLSITLEPLFFCNSLKELIFLVKNKSE